nr:hypothetical protein [Leptospirillum ferriphilum]
MKKKIVPILHQKTFRQKRPEFRKTLQVTGSDQYMKKKRVGNPFFNRRQNSFRLLRMNGRQQQSKRSSILTPPNFLSPLNPFGKERAVSAAFQWIGDVPFEISGEMYILFGNSQRPESFKIFSGLHHDRFQRSKKPGKQKTEPAHPPEPSRRQASIDNPCRNPEAHGTQ